MKTSKVLSSVSLIIFLFFISAVSVKAVETLEATSWDVKILTYSLTSGNIQVSTAEITFMDGYLMINGWSEQLLPGPYEEMPSKKGVHFSSVLQKPGGVIQQYVQNLSIEGMTVMGKGIAGVIENTTTGWYYFFFGEPSSAE
jgi:hypothetical protein